MITDEAFINLAEPGGRLNDDDDDNDEQDDEDQLALAMREVDDEMYLFPPERDYLEHLPFSSKSRTFTTQLLENELQAIENNELTGQLATDLSIQNFDLPPQTKQTAAIEDDEEFANWMKCLNQLKLRLEYGQRQMVNLELMKIYGNEVWEQCRKETELLESMLKTNLEDIKKQHQMQEELEWKRHSDKDKLTKQLEVLQREWRNLEERSRILAETIRKL